MSSSRGFAVPPKEVLPSHSIDQFADFARNLDVRLVSDHLTDISKPRPAVAAQRLTVSG